MTTEIEATTKGKRIQDVNVNFKANLHFNNNLTSLSKATGRAKADLIKQAIQSMYLDYLQANIA